MEIVLSRLFRLAAFLLLFLHHGSPANILVFEALGSHSTRISIFPLMEALAEKGHKVTFLSSFDNFEDPNKRSKITYFTPEKLKNSFGGWEDDHTFFEVRKAGISPAVWKDILDAGLEACKNLYADPEVMKWVKRSKFDLIIAESAANECAYGLVPVFNAKLAIYGTARPFPWFMDAYGLPDESSTLTDVSFNFPHREKEGMTFWERLQNGLTPVYFDLYREYSYFPALEKATQNALGLSPEELPSFREIERNVSLVFLSVHPTVDYPRSLPPHVIPIGGAVASGKMEKPLSPEMAQFLDSGKEHGCVYISFGTVTEFANFDEEVRVEFINALRSFPKLKFLWKAGIPIKEPLPKNVMVTKWAPQQAVLAHPNVKLFITHAGMGSAAETAHFGVPVVSLPVLADQDVNSRMLAARGVGVELEILTLKQKELEWAISEVLNNPKYKTAMKQLSLAFRDRPTPPIETAVWYVEFILRHDNSNEYLVPLTLRQRQPWWKRRQLDVWLAVATTILLATSLAVLFLYFSTSRLLRILFSSPLKKDDRGKKLKSK